jgi:hypothetical protein
MKLTIFVNNLRCRNIFGRAEESKNFKKMKLKMQEM